MVIRKNDLRSKINNSLIVGMMQAYRRIETELRNYLKPYGVSLQQYNVLKILKGADAPLSTSVIRDRMVQPMTDSSRLVDRLCSKGWVNRYACSIDKRLVDVTISKEGIEFLESIPNFDSLFDSFYSKISHNEVVELNHLLNKMRV